jgi:hypothetical protein
MTGHCWKPLLSSSCRASGVKRDNYLLGEFGIALVFALLARTLRRDSWRVAIVAGIAGGASIFVCSAAAFLITDRLIS